MGFGLISWLVYQAGRGRDGKGRGLTMSSSCFLPSRNEDQGIYPIPRIKKPGLENRVRDEERVEIKRGSDT